MTKLLSNCVLLLYPLLMLSNKIVLINDGKILLEYKNEKPLKDREYGKIYEGREIYYFVPNDKRSCVKWYIASKILKTKVKREKLQRL